MNYSLAMKLTADEGRACRMLGGDESWNPYGPDQPEYRSRWSSGWSEMNARIRAASGGAQQELRSR